MERAVIFVSDLHLGTGDELEDFVPENEQAFCDFVKQQSDNLTNREVDFVLLGDLLDIWQVATEADKHAEKSDQIDISVQNELEAERVKEIIAAHPKTLPLSGNSWTKTPVAGESSAFRATTTTP